MFVTKEFKFHAAHYLTKYHGACERLHGHTYTLQVTVEGEVQSNGLVLDFSILKKIVKERVLSKVDHYNLNDLFENPTTETLTKWIWDQLEDLPSLLQAEKDHPNLSDEIKGYLENPETATKDISTAVRLYEVKVWETDTSFATYRG